MTHNVVCPYCSATARKVFGSVIYPHRTDLYSKVFYLCKPCNAYVGCHPGTSNPLGRLANAELRRAKSAAHAAFDPLWRKGAMSRSAAYSWLAESLTLKAKDCHIGMFDEELCQRTVDLCIARDIG